jgi:hypothetical protein
MPGPDIADIKAHLRETLTKFKKTPRGKLAYLVQIKSELLDLRAKGASAKYISERLKEKNFSVSKDTILKFLGKKKRTKKNRKSKGNEAA